MRLSYTPKPWAASDFWMPFCVANLALPSTTELHISRVLLLSWLSLCQPLLGVLGEMSADLVYVSLAVSGMGYSSLCL